MVKKHPRTPARPAAILYRGRLETSPVVTILTPGHFALEPIHGADKIPPVPNPTTPVHSSRPKTPRSTVRTFSASTNHFQPQLPAPGTISIELPIDDSSDCGQPKRRRRWPDISHANARLGIDQTKSRIHICKKRSEWPEDMFGSNSIDPDKLDPSVVISEAEVAKVKQGIAEYGAVARDATARGDLISAKVAQDNAIAISKCLETAFQARMVSNKKRAVTHGKYWIPKEDQLKAHADPELFVGMPLAESIRDEYPFLRCQGWDELDYDKFGKLILPREERTLGQLEMYAKVLENRAMFMVLGTSLNCQSMLVAADDREDVFP